jgi:hydroxysqualene dehydroxylase
LDANRGRRIAVIGGGWAGCAAAVLAVQQGHQVSLFEATRSWGGRARGLRSVDRAAKTSFDNGQHIFIGAYCETMALMRSIGLQPEGLLQRQALDLRFADSTGFALNPLPTWFPSALANPLSALIGIVCTKGWSWSDKFSLLQHCLRWQLNGFKCAPDLSVLALCNQSRQALSRRVMAELIEPLCLSALNTHPAIASGAVFLRVLHDALLSGRGSSDLLIPKRDLSALFPDEAVVWLQSQGAQIHSGQRVQSLDDLMNQAQPFDAVVLACPPWEAQRLLQSHAAPDWLAALEGLTYEAIATVYAHSPAWAKDSPAWSLRALRCGLNDATPLLSADKQSEAQFVFNRVRFHPSSAAGDLAFVVSAAHADRDAIEQAIRQQAAQQLDIQDLVIQQTIIEKRATFACTPALKRPSNLVPMTTHRPEFPLLVACGDYVEGEYPATIEGAVRSAHRAVECLQAQWIH